MPRTKRKDKSRVVLRTGESQRADGTYHFSWTDANHKTVSDSRNIRQPSTKQFAVLFVTVTMSSC